MSNQRNEATRRPRKDADYVRRSFYLPRHLVERLEELALEEGEDSSQVLAMALEEHFEHLKTQEIDPERLPIIESATEETRAKPPEEITDLPDSDDSQETSGSETDLTSSLRERLGVLGTSPLNSPPVRDTLVSVAGIIEQRDAFTEGHAVGVADLARAVSETLDLPADQVLAIELAGLAHELGKLAVPRSILGKQGRLTESEKKTMRRYPQVAAELLRSVPALQPLERIVMHHQERWDGSGYPEQLEGDEIPLGAQVVGICDVYHALVSARAYRPALTPKEARTVIEDGIGRLWSPQVARALLEVVESEEADGDD